MAWMIAIDTGGTFTDVIGVERDSGRLHTVKVPSNPQDPSDAVLRGVVAFIAEVPGASAADITCDAHGRARVDNA